MKPLCCAVSILALAFLGGCRSDVSYVQLDPTVLSPKPEGYDVPFSYEVPSRAHRVLGEVKVTSEIKSDFNETSTFDQVMDKMKEQARKVGADAIVDLKTIDASGHEEGRLTMVGSFIIYTEPPALSGMN